MKPTNVNVDKGLLGRSWVDWSGNEVKAGGVSILMLPTCMNLSNNKFNKSYNENTTKQVLWNLGENNSLIISYLDIKCSILQCFR